MRTAMLRCLLPFALLLACSSTSDGAPSPAPASPSAAQIEEADPPTPSPRDPIPPMTVSESDVAAAAASINGFSTDLYGRVRGEQGNLILSPASVAIALGMTLQGASGETAEQLRAVLHVEASELEPQVWHAAMGQLGSSWTTPPPGEHRNPPPEVSLANRLFGARRVSFRQEFLDASERAYRARLERLDFSNPEPARAHINDWVEAQTRDRIVDLIPSGGITADTALVLANAVYFKAQWRHPFSEGATKDAPFATGSGERALVPTMRNTASYRYAVEGGVTLVELPYVGGGFAMMIAMPTKRGGLTRLEGGLTPERFEAWDAALAPTRIALSMPKFRIEPAAPLALGDALRAAGLERAFTDAAQFDPMVEPGQAKVQISEVFHKGFIEVDEKGTEAAAATAVAMATMGVPAEPEPVAIDRPFLFVLRDTHSGALLFMGRVVDPR